MKYSFATLAVVALASVVSAQTGVPSCAQPCIDAAVKSSTTCSSSDLQCQCQPANEQAIQSAATTCVLSSCSQDDALAAESAAQALCKQIQSAPPPASSAPPASYAPPVSSAPPTSAAPYSAPPAGPSSVPYSAPSSAAPAGTGAPAAVTGVSTVTVFSCFSSSSSTPVVVPTSVPVPAKSNVTVATGTLPSKPPMFTGAASQLSASLAGVLTLGVVALAAL